MANSYMYLAISYHCGQQFFYHYTTAFASSHILAEMSLIFIL